MNSSTSILHSPSSILHSLLVTGVAGFIGSNFIYYMQKHYPSLKIVGLDNLSYAGNLANLSKLPNKQNFHFVKGDICDFALVDKLFNKHKIDGVINFAAESHVDRSIHNSSAFIRTNIQGTHTLLEVAKKHWYVDGVWEKEKRFLQVSTDEVYGSLGKTGYFTESTPLDPHSPYSASKASADLIAKAYYDTYKMPVLITRCSNNYGPYQFPEKLIPLLINNCLEAKSLPVYGDGKNVRDWLFVDDHCSAVDLVFRAGVLGEVYNIGGSNERQNIYIVKKVIKTLSKTNPQVSEKLITYVKDRLGHDRRYAIDSTKIQKQLGWSPKTTFEVGIAKTIAWYLENRTWMQSVISGDYKSFYEVNYGK